MRDAHPAREFFVAIPVELDADPTVLVGVDLLPVLPATLAVCMLSTCGFGVTICARNGRSLFRNS